MKIQGRRLPNDNEDSYLLYLDFKKPSSIFSLPLYWLRTGFSMSTNLKLYESEVARLLIENQSDDTVTIYKDGKPFIRGLSHAADLISLKVELGDQNINTEKHKQLYRSL